MKKLDDIFSEIQEYCNLNGIDDFEGVVYDCLSKGFNILRFGTSPRDNFMRENGIKDTSKKESIKPKEKTTKKTRTIKENV